MISEEIKSELLKVKKKKNLKYKEEFIRLIDFALENDKLDVHIRGCGLHHYAVYNRLEYLAKLLLDSGVKYKHISEEIRDRLIVFHYFEKDKNMRDNLESVIESGNINCKDSTLSEYRLIHYAVRNKDIELVKLLLENGAFVNVYTIEGNTPLILAIKGNCVEIVDILLRHGADISLKGQYDRTPLEIAKDWGYEEVIALIEKYEESEEKELKEDVKRLIKM